MKARVKATGKLLENVIPIMSVDSKVVMFHEYGTENDYYYYEDLDFSNTIDWEQVYIQAAIAAMQGMLANPQTFEQIDHDEGYKEVCGGDKLKIVAKASVMYADALVAELKHCDDVYAECRRMDAINTAAVCENMTKIQKELQRGK